MPKKNRHLPSYRLHKPSGQARVIIDSKHHYLGKYGTSESWEKYHRLVAESLSHPVNASRTDPASRGISDILIGELILAYWEYAQARYVRDGKPTDRLYHVRLAMRPLRKLYGTTLAGDFGPRKLKAVREHMITEGLKERNGLNREYINDHIGIIKRMFRWAAAEESVPTGVHQALETLESIQKGRDPRVKGSKKICPAPEKHVQAVLPVVSPQIRTMIELQLLTGMRPDEVTIMRPCDIDRNGEVWLYVPEGHKMEYMDIEKIIPLGPRAQEILAPWLARDSTAYLFTPKEVVKASIEQRRRRNMPKNPPSRNGLRRLRDHYDDETYCQAVERGCRKAGVPKWTPGQLRHNAGTSIRREYGLEAARLVLGHRSASTTEIYAEKDREKAQEIMRKIG